jgi:hypothetical protein
MEEMINSYRISVRKPEGKRRMGDSGVDGRIISKQVRFKVFTAVKMTMLFWVVSLCGLVGKYQYFRDSMFLRNVGN